MLVILVRNNFTSTHFTSESIVEGIPYPQKVVYGNTSQTLLLFFLGSEEGAEVVKQALLKSVGKVTDIVSSLGFSWWQGGPPHSQTLKELHWVSPQHNSD